MVQETSSNALFGGVVAGNFGTELKRFGIATSKSERTHDIPEVTVAVAIHFGFIQSQLLSAVTMISTLVGVSSSTELACVVISKSNVQVPAESSRMLSDVGEAIVRVTAVSPTLWDPPGTVAYFTTMSYCEYVVL